MRFGIVNAMAEEKVALLEGMTDQAEVTIDGKVFYTGKVGQQDVVIVEAGIGKVAAAITTTLLLNSFDIDYVINSGSAGALGHDLKIGDVVVANELAYADADARAFGYVYGQVPQQPARYVTDAWLSEQLMQDFAKATDKQRLQGLIVTSDSFIADDAQKETILSHFPDALSAEMEGAAIAQVATTYQKPFAVVRAISDNANGEAGPTFDDFIIEAGRQSAQVLLDFLNQAE
ncbi:adenosylhomocysteine nucleosidase [Weissella uvarum]|uniref:5'-methylthioadenosine/adenosylhomocysteine nucleosidase n=1 Tax=Weissella uvarum TaxID=1479233 RepID=UPI0019621A3C|nr:5'-methylthioadenosine/adenosylhomocysteine nucleosidase [Weissella uvarum]MBM7617828.1 adenosylhomocysteine nucleosidase [Weissella uvarum]MCM0595793.1 5'-methylthioadenosine/adenosylhomocysteine nucleosidase [Weissella uvarum]